jgi:LysM repeat protein
MNEPLPDAAEEAHASPVGVVVCPFLVSAGGPWRSAEPTREHRCSRQGHDTRLDLDHQRRYCLGSGGPGCPHHVVARAPGRLVSMLPVVVDRGPLGSTLEPDRVRRLAAPAAVVIVGAAVGAFLLARGPGAPGQPPGSGVASPTPKPSTVAVVAPSSSPASAPPSATPGPTPTGQSSSPSPLPSPSPTPGAGGTYTVRSGDTLGAIAARFGTTSRALVQLNKIANASLIRPGQVLKLP